VTLFYGHISGDNFHTRLRSVVDDLVLHTEAVPLLTRVAVYRIGLPGTRKGGNFSELGATTCVSHR
jgi:hypothetical protein